MANEMYRVRMRRPNVLVVRNNDSQAGIDIPKQDEKGDATIRRVNLATAQDWIACGIAEAIDALPKAQPAKA